MTTGKNNILNNRCPPCRSGAPSGEKEDVVFTSCSRCFPIDTLAMRSKILDLAMRGKLTEQLPEDGTAEALYRQIQEKKQALIQAYKLKKEKPLQEITADELSVEIPKNWKTCRFGALITLVSGTDYPPDEYNDACRGTPYITGASNLLAEGVLINRWTEKARCIANLGDVLLVCKGSGYGKVAMCDINEAHIARQIMAVKRTPLLEMRFVLYFLMAQFNYLKEKGQGLIPGVDRKSVLNMLFPLPPLVEQQRIVERIEQALAILDTIDALQAQYADNLTVLKSKLIDAAIQGKLTEQLPEDGTAEELYQQIQLENQVLINAGPIKKAKPLAAITEDEIPFDIPANWKWVRLASVVDMLAGFAFKSADFKSAGKYRLLRGINLGVNSIRWNDTVYLDAIPERLSEYRIQSGDVLIGLDRPWISGGTRVAIFDDTQETYLVQRVLRLRESGGVVRSYIALILRSSLLIKSLGDKTTGISVPHISPGQVGNLVVPLPPLAEQKRIVAKLEAILPLCEGPKN